MTLREIAQQVGGWVAPEHEGVTISGPGSLDDAGEGELAFFGNPKYLKSLRKSRATAVLVPHGFSEEITPIRIWVDNPATAFAALLPAFVPPPIIPAPGIHPTALIGHGVVLGEGVSVGAFAIIESGAVIGKGSLIESRVTIGHESVIGENCRIYPGVVIRERCRLGNRVIVQPNTTIGSDGFGYEFRDGRHHKIPQTGIVEIGDDVEIGANTTIDRARFGRTRVAHGTKIDNLVMVAHNVNIGPHSILCAQSGVSGSTRLGSYVTLAGQAGLAGHIEVGDGAIVCAQSGIGKSLKPGEVVLGSPARPIKEYKRLVAVFSNLDKLQERVRKLEQAE